MPRPSSARSPAWPRPLMPSDGGSRNHGDQGLLPADHLSGSLLLKLACPEVRVAIGHRITLVQAMFKGTFGLPPGFPIDGSQFDRRERR